MSIDYQGIAMLITSISALLSAGVGVGSFIRTGYIEKRVQNTQQAIVEVKRNVETIEQATNSMKDALVKATSDASYAQGHAIGQAEERANPLGPITKATE